MNSRPRTPQKHPKSIQTIKYSGNESEYSSKVVKQDVTVQCSSGKHTHGSSKVKLINRIDYNWEFQYYHGNLVAVHINGKIIAYGMKGKEGGMVRVTNQETGERALIKNLKTDVRDVAFAFSKQQIILGCIDDEGNVLIYEIIDERSSIKLKLLLHIFHSDVVPHSNPNFRLIWCPYLSCFDEDDETGDEPEKMFVVLNGDKAEIWNFNMINAKYGIGPLEPNINYEGYVEISHDAELVDASFSSDGTAIAVACADGYVKFFQINIVDNEQPKCLHEWRPHDGKPLSSIIFADNLLECSSQCWKFTITGANYNSELKLWSCETWTCLQTINFVPEPNNLIQNVFFKIAIDYSGHFLIMSDINNKVLYVLELKRNDEAQEIGVTSLSQFLLPAAFLSFHITEANVRKLRASDSVEFNNDDLEDEEEDELIGGLDGQDSGAVFVNLLIIQQKKFQECNVVFEPEKIQIPSEINENSVEKIPKLDDLQSSVTLLIQQQQQMTLLPPEAFTTAENGDTIKTEDEKTDLIDFQRPEKDNFASGGSSPSREVQEILSLNNTNYNNDYFENLAKIQQPEEIIIPQKEAQEPSNNVWMKLSGIKTEKADLMQNSSDELVNLNLNEGEWGKTHVQAINFRLSTIENHLSDQNLVLQKISQELKQLNQGKDAVKEQMGKDIELAMSKQQLQIAKMLENLINMQKNSDREHQEQIIASVSQIVSKTVSDKLQNVVANEMKMVVVPTIRNLVEALKHQLDVQNSQKLNSDLVLQEKIAKMVNVKALSESLSHTVSNVLTPILDKCYREMIQTTLVPSWEKVCANMFHQVNDTFSKGTKEYTQSVESYMERQRRAQERGKDLVGQMAQFSESLQLNTEKLTANLTAELQKNMNTTVKNMHESLLQNIKDVVGEQINAGFKSHASVLEDSVINAVRSRAVTPAPHPDNTQATLAHIDHLLGKDCYDEAFQWALSAENLNIVIYVCEKVDANMLFASTCCLQQNCILALIQQLSMELHKSTELKLSYIRGALVALTPGYANTKQFIPKVLRDLLRQFQIFMATNPSSKLVNDVKLIKMVVESILDK